jgi:hypothetical protein
MFRRNGALFALAAIMALVLAGCGAATPTRLLPTQPPQVITVIITATPPPETATSAAPSITPLPTVNVTTTVQAAVTEAKPTVAGATKPAVVATKKPTAPLATTATNTSGPLTLPAPVLVSPNFNPEQGRKDERHSPSDALVFEWQSINPLSVGVCYQVRVDFTPGAGDTFLQCDPNESQKARALTVRFTLNQPRYPSPNYGSLLPNPPNDLTVKWFVTVVRDDGVGPDGMHHKTTPLSPKSETFQFLLKGGGQ